MRYRVVHAGDIKALEEQVAVALRNGWTPQGGLLADGGVFYQALVKTQERSA